jgi:glutamate-1-semialdehyde 2,1-aminomutase
LTEVLAKTVVLPYNDIAAVRAAFDQHGPEIAAVIVEPIAHNVGAILPSEGFLATLRELCTRAGSVLVFDEVITGFRHALGGVQALWDVTPDLTTLGKAMANGYPIAALVGRADLMENFSTVRSGQVLFAGTYNGHPMSVAAAIETIAVLRDSDVYDRLFALGDAARTGLTNVFAELEIPVVVSGFGSVFVAYFMSEPVREYADLLRNDAEAFVAHRRGLFERGAFLFPANLKRAHLSYSHTDADVGFLIEQSREVLADMTFAKVAHR